MRKHRCRSAVPQSAGGACSGPVPLWMLQRRNVCDNAPRPRQQRVHDWLAGRVRRRGLQQRLRISLVQLLHNTNVPSCYAAADNRLRQSADWCRPPLPPALPAAARDPSPLAAGARSHALRTQSSGPTGGGGGGGVQGDAGLGCRVLGASGFHAWAGTAYPFRTW